MVTKLILGEPKGYITVTKGVFPVFPFGKKFVISKYEAKSISVVATETSSIIRQLGVALLALMALLPIGPPRKLRYEVKIRSSSGEDITLFRHQNVDLVNNIVNQVTDFIQNE